MKIITIDGYSGCGKSSLAKLIANKYKLPWLDSGAIYRALALFYITYEYNDIEEMINEFQKYIISFNSEGQILLNSKNIDKKIRQPNIAEQASKLAKIKVIRDNLLKIQRDQLTPLGLVADGRDMGSVVFPNANFKFFLTADIKTRTNRRYKELQLIGKNVSIAELMQSIESRDSRDIKRSNSPLKAAKDAIVIDTSAMSLEQVFQLCIDYIERN